MLNTDEKSKASANRLQAYTKPSVIARGNIMSVTKGGGLTPGDTGLTFISPGGGS